MLQELVSNGSSNLLSMLHLFSLIDNSSGIEDEFYEPYTIGDRTVEVINTSSELENAMKTIERSPFIGFDTEQKPTFQKGQASHGVSLIQLATASKCYLIQNKQIKNIKPLIKLLENPRVIKVGTGLKGDNEALLKQFNLRLRSTIDLENTFKKLSSKNQIGAKRAALIILEQKLQKAKKISRSNWENKLLTEAQIKYASEDATVIFDVLNQMLQQYPFILDILPPFFQSNYKK